MKYHEKMDAVKATRGLSAAERWILFVLTTYTNGSLECWPSLATLASDCETSRGAVARSLSRLEAKGVISRNRSAGGVSTRYRINLERPHPETDEAQFQQSHPEATTVSPRGHNSLTTRPQQSHHEARTTQELSNELITDLKNPPNPPGGTGEDEDREPDVEDAEIVGETDPITSMGNCTHPVSHDAAADPDLAPRDLFGPIESEAQQEPVASLPKQTATTAKGGPVAIAGEEEFERFWDAYDYKVGKVEAREAWKKALKAGHDPEMIIAAAAFHAANWDPSKPKNYRLHPVRWLKRERWEDDPETIISQRNSENVYRPTNADLALEEIERLAAERQRQGAPDRDLGAVVTPLRQEFASLGPRQGPGRLPDDRRALPGRDACDGHSELEPPREESPSPFRYVGGMRERYA